MSTLDHGGARPGSGRKPGSGAYGEPTQQLRIPVSQRDTVVAFLDAYRQPAVGLEPRQVSLTPRTLALTAFASRVPAGLLPFPSR